MLCHQQRHRLTLLFVIHWTKLKKEGNKTYIVHLELGARVAHTLKNLLDLGQKTY